MTKLRDETDLNVPARKATIRSVNAGGPFARKFREHLDEGYEDSAVSESIMAQARKAAERFANPQSEVHCLRKILAVGRVQCGKTTFFLATAAYAFDNGIPIAILIGGTKLNLLEQNVTRLKAEFANNPSVHVLSVRDFGSDWSLQDIHDIIAKGERVFIATLKQGSENCNIGGLADLAQQGGGAYPALVIDDEGDEQGLGSNQKGAREAVRHRIEDLLSSFRSVTYISVTASPQANLLVSTDHSLTPDTAVLVRPGRGYIGLSDYLGSAGHLRLVTDEEELKNGRIPVSLSEAIRDFIGGAAIKRLMGDKGRYSMMVHNSFRASDHDIDIDSVKSILSAKRRPLSSSGDAYREAKEWFLTYFREYQENHPDAPLSDESGYIEEVKAVLSTLGVYKVNCQSKEDREREPKENRTYRIYVGGNMLGRGLTIKNLTVSYMIRDSRIPQVDTVYQRARWLGYKSRYFDICRLYLTRNLERQFEAIEEHENDLIVSLENYLRVAEEAGNPGDLHLYPRIFSLRQGETNLILTRKSIAKTIRAEGELPPETVRYNLSTEWSEEEARFNNRLLRGFMETHQTDGQIVQYGKWRNEEGRLYRQAWVLRGFSYRALFQEFLGEYIYPESAFTTRPCLLPYFKALLGKVESGEYPDVLNVIVYRPQIGERRSNVDAHVRAIPELFQGSDSGTEFPGDRYIPDFQNHMALGVHLIHQSDRQKADKDSWLVLLSFSNPDTVEKIKAAIAVTGDNYYGPAH